MISCVRLLLLHAIFFSDSSRVEQIQPFDYLLKICAIQQTFAVTNQKLMR